MSGHSVLSPSSADRWVHCPGSVSLSALFPDDSGAAAEEGTAAHWVGSEVLEGRGGDPFVGRTAPNSVIITEEIEDAAKVYVQHVRSIASRGQKLMVERTIPIAPIHAECFGTFDCAFWNGPKELHIWDLKYGYGIVEPRDNWQLICYAAGLLEGLSGIEDQTVQVNLHIVQPRPYHANGPVRTWSVAASDLRGKINKLAHAAALALGGNPETVSGPHCKYCRARHVCASAQKMALWATEYTESARVEELSPDALAIEIRTLQRAAEAITYRLTGLEAQGKALIKSGAVLPGFALQNGNGRQDWSVPLQEVFAMGDLLGVDLRKTAAITPTQAKKAGLAEEVIATLSARSASEAKLVPFDMKKVFVKA